ncbi:MAG: hypothetical protein GMKNLPBB_00487 [Myxococcota bacterium]|nr:hypothetical protein [Myxococcota bacterium]
MIRTFSRWLAALLCVIPMTVFAYFNSAPPMDVPEPPPLKKGQDNYKAVYTRAGLGQMGEDFFLRLDVGLDLDFGPFGLGLAAPLDVLLVDNDPKSRDDAPGKFIRPGQYDEPSDFLRFIRYLRFGRKGETFYLRLGMLAAETIGHGTIVDNYYNNLDFDHYRFGASFQLNTPQITVESLLGNAINPYLFGGRLGVRPWAFADPKAFMSRLKISASIFTDLKAPRVLQSAPAGYPQGDGLDNDRDNLVDEPGERRLFMDTQRYPVVDRSHNLIITGVDAEMNLIQEEWVDMTPYTDLNFILEHGKGFHGGLLTRFRAGKVLGIDTRLEGRAFDGDYIPSYFDSTYEVQRYQLPGAVTTGDLPKPKAAWLEDLRGAAARLGWYAEAALRFSSFFVIGAGYDDYQGRDNANFMLFAEVPAFDFLEVGAYYYKRRFDDFGEVFDFDSRSLLLGRARLHLGGFSFIEAKYWRVWQTDPMTGQIIPANDWSIGGGLVFSF